jgi:hypothetical protein
MSFDIFIQRCERGNPAPIARPVIEREFGPFIRSRSAGFRQAAYDDGGTADIYIQDEGDIDGFSVSRPPNSPAFWVNVFNILRDTGSVLYWPGGGQASLVVSADAVEHVPLDFIEALGKPSVVVSAAEIPDRIAAS